MRKGMSLYCQHGNQDYVEIKKNLQLSKNVKFVGNKIRIFFYH
jgi:hypothetical protein